MGNMSKRQQPDQRADKSGRPPMGLQCSEKILHPEVGLILHLNKNVYQFSENGSHTCTKLQNMYLFLYCYELQFMTKISKDPSKQHLIQKFNNTFRYSDDIQALNNDDFSMNTKEIYPVELTLNKAITNNDHCPFLDLDIYIINRKLNTKIYDN